MVLNDNFFIKFKNSNQKIKNISNCDIPYEIINSDNTSFLLSTSFYNYDIKIPDFNVFKKNYLDCLELIYGIREKKSKKLKKSGVNNLLKAGEIDCLKDDVNKILNALNSNFDELCHMLSKRFSSSHKLFLMLLSFYKKQDLLFIDIETKGLYFETAIITIGLGFFENEKFFLKQLTILNDAAEYEILNEFLKILKNKKAFITFNGKTFDISFLENRLSYYAFDYESLNNFHNFDLLHFSRKSYKNIIDSFKLKDIEKLILKKTRNNDISSEEIEIYYSSYLKTGNLKYLQPIIYHNREDIISMLLLLNKIVEKWTE